MLLRLLCVVCYARESYPACRSLCPAGSSSVRPTRRGRGAPSAPCALRSRHLRPLCRTRRGAALTRLFAIGQSRPTVLRLTTELARHRLTCRLECSWSSDGKARAEVLQGKGAAIPLSPPCNGPRTCGDRTACGNQPRKKRTANSTPNTSPMATTEIMARNWKSVIKKRPWQRAK